MDVWRGRSVQIISMRLVLVWIVFRRSVVVLGVVLGVVVCRLVVVLVMASVGHRVPVVVGLGMVGVVRVLGVHGGDVSRCLRYHLMLLRVDMDLRVN